MIENQTRQAAVAGQFYPATPEKIDQMIKRIQQSEFFDYLSKYKDKNIFGGIVPHAGYVYSGYQAIHFFALISRYAEFDTVVIVNPNHTGFGDPISLDSNDFWQTPYGKVAIDTEFAQELQLPKNAHAHSREHSGEVMLPFLQYFFGEQKKIVPICMMQQNAASAAKLAKSILHAEQQTGRRILLLASSDFSHFVHPVTGAQADDEALSHFLKFDSDAAEMVIRNNRLSICGYGPIMTLIEYAVLKSDNPTMDILKRGHSGQVHYSDSVVHYISTVAFA